MAKKKVTTKRKPSTQTVDLISSSEKIKFNIIEDGVDKGSIEDTIFALHRTVLQSQAEAIDADKSEYLPFLVNALKRKFGVSVSQESAYLLAIEVFERFDVEKKSSDG